MYEGAPLPSTYGGRQACAHVGPSPCLRLCARCVLDETRPSRPLQKKGSPPADVEQRAGRGKRRQIKPAARGREKENHHRVPMQSCHPMHHCIRGVCDFDEGLQRELLPAFYFLGETVTSLLVPFSICPRFRPTLEALVIGVHRWRRRPPRLRGISRQQIFAPSLSRSGRRRPI